MDWATFWATFPQTPLVTLLGGTTFFCPPSKCRNSNCRKETVDITNEPNLTYPKATWKSPNPYGGHRTPAWGCLEGSDELKV
jgi:hypothetical protein